MIRKFIAAAAAVAALALGGCATLGTPTTGAEAALKADKALFFAEAGLQGAGVLADAGLIAGSLKGARAVKGGDLYGRACQTIGATRTVEGLLTGGLEGQAFATLSLVAQAQAIFAPASRPPPGSAEAEATALELLTTAIAASPELAQLVAEVRTVARATSRAEIAPLLARRRAENDADCPRLVAALAGAGG